MPTSTQRFRLVGEDDASRAFLEVAAAAKLLKSNMDDVGSSALGLTKLIGGAGLIPVAAAATAAVTELGTALGAAGGALGVFGLSVGGFAKQMVKQQQTIAATQKSLSGLTKGTKSYHDTLVKLHSQQRTFNHDFGPAAKGLDDMKASFQKFLDATGPVTKGVLAKGFQLVADVLPKLVPVSNAAGKAVGGLLDDLSNWTKGPGFKDFLHFLETSGPKDISAFGHIIGNTVSGLAGILKNFVGPGDNAAASLEGLTKKFAAWGHSKGVSDSVNKFLKYISDNGPQISSVFASIAKVAPKLAVALGNIGAANLTLTGRFLSLVAGLPQRQFNLIADGLFAIAAGAKAVAIVNGLAGAGGALKSILANKGILGKIGGAAGGASGLGGKGVVPVYVTNEGFGGPGGGGGVTAGRLAKYFGYGAAGAEAGATGTTISAAAVAALAVPAAAIVYAGFIQRNIKPYGDHTADPGIARGGRYAQQHYGIAPGPAEGRNEPGAVADARARGYAKVKDAVTGYDQAVKSVTNHLDTMRNSASKASQAVEEIGPRGKAAAKQAADAIVALAGHGTALDSVKAKGAQASQTLDLIGPHAEQSSGIAVTAISGVVSILDHIHDRSIKITANTSQAMANIAAMRYAVDQLHDKTIIVRAIGGHVPGDPTGPTNPDPTSRGSGSSTGNGPTKSFARAGASAASDYMASLLKGIAGRKMLVENAVAKIADALSRIKGKVSNLKGVRSGFRSTFTADSIFGQDFSHTTTDAAGIQSSTPGTVADAIAFQAAQRAKAVQLNQDIKRVTKLGLSKSLIAQLRRQGAAGAATLHSLASATPEQIQQLNQLNRQTNSSLASAGMRAGNYDRGGSVNRDIQIARKQEHTLELLEHHLKDLAKSEKKGQTIVVEIDGEAIIKSIVRRNKRKGVKTAGI